jgi:capsid protein
VWLLVSVDHLQIYIYNRVWGVRTDEGTPLVLFEYKWSEREQKPMKTDDSKRMRQNIRIKKNYGARQIYPLTKNARQLEVRNLYGVNISELMISPSIGSSDLKAES